MIKYVIVGLSGKRGSGKDALSKKLAPLGWVRVSFADELKRRVRKDFKLSKEHTDGKLKEQPTKYVNAEGKVLTTRDIMGLCGTYFRAVDPMFWVKQVFKRLDVKSKKNVVKKLVITDVRFPNEARFLRKNGAVIVRIERNPKLNIYKKKLKDHTETQLDNYKFDYKIPMERNVNFADLEREANVVDKKFGNRVIKIKFKL